MDNLFVPEVRLAHERIPQLGADQILPKSGPLLLRRDELPRRLFGENNRCTIAELAVLLAEGGFPRA
jgi:hypothetical protein